MNRFIITVLILFTTFRLFSQDGGYRNNFNDNSLGSGWNFHPGGIILSEENQYLKVTGSDWDNVWFNFYCYWGFINLNNRPYVSLRIKSDTAINLRIYLSGETKSTSYIDRFVPKTLGFDTLYFDFTGMFGTVDPGVIKQIDFRINPGSNFKGSFYIDDLALGDSALTPAPVCDGSSVKIDTVQILIAADSIAILEKAPFSDAVVHGEFIDGNGMHYPDVELHYRGAFDLMGLIFSGTRRNWKVKFTKTQKYFDEREWNYNYRTYSNDQTALDLFKKAGVKAPSTRLVVLYVNGARQGPYLEMEDPDNKPFLQKSYGDDSGDLYKAATDLPYMDTTYFGGLNFLGNHDSDYYKHYQKKTNNDSFAYDYSSIRKFITMLAFLPNDKFVDSLKKYFDTESFTRYLVVSNFMSNWDSYPQRPKNYWIYNSPKKSKWYFIPWDVNGTFEMQAKSSVDHMGTNCSIFFQFFKSENVTYSQEEDTGKLLVRRMMMYAQFRNAYVLEYQKALTTYLSKESLYGYLDSIANMTGCHLPNPEFQAYTSSMAEIKTFIDYKTSSVEKQLSNITLWDTIPVTGYIPPDTITHSGLPATIHSGFQVSDAYPNPFVDNINLIINADKPERIIIGIYDITGVQVYSSFIEINTGQCEIQMGSNLNSGMYLIKITGNSGSFYLRKAQKI